MGLIYRLQPDTSLAIIQLSNHSEHLVFFGGGCSLFLKKGIALDLSRDGTRVRFQNSDSLLDGMVVSISRYGIKRKARMRWRTRTDVGVEFLDEVE